MTRAGLPNWLQDMLANCPTAGSGVHSWLFRTARQLLAHYPATEVIKLLEQGSARCGRHVPEREIVQAVQAAVGCAWQPKTCNYSIAPGRRWPALNAEQREAIIRDGLRLADLWEVSPVRIDDSESHTEAIIDSLYPGNPLLCCGKSSQEFDTKPRDRWRGELAGLQLIVPSPMSDVTGTTQDGRQSKHTLSNTGPRRFLVVEFDPPKWECLSAEGQKNYQTKNAYYSAMLDEHAAVLFHLGSIGPLVLVVHSGSKSLHGWFYCEGRDEDKLFKFMQLAVSLGADHATWTRSQFCRMPDGTRDGGRRQAVYFFNPPHH